MKAFVFDIGDCIQPSTRIQIENLEHLKKKHFLPDEFVKAYLENDKYHELHMFHAGGEPKIMHKTLVKLGLNLNAEELSKEMQELFWTKVKKYYTKEEPGKEFISALNFLKQQGYKIAILSDNSLQAKEGYLKLWKELNLRFDVFVVSAELGTEKPSKEIFQKVLKQLNVKPEDAVYFGNSLERDSVATKYGWDFVWVYGFMNINPRIFQGKKIKYITVQGIKDYLESKET